MIKPIYKTSNIIQMEATECGAISLKLLLAYHGKYVPIDVAEKICDKVGLDKNKLIKMNKGECNENRINLPEYVDEDFARLFGGKT